MEKWNETNKEVKISLEIHIDLGLDYKFWCCIEEHATSINNCSISHMALKGDSHD